MGGFSIGVVPSVKHNGKVKTVVELKLKDRRGGQVGRVLILDNDGNGRMEVGKDRIIEFHRSSRFCSGGSRFIHNRTIPHCSARRVTALDVLQYGRAVSGIFRQEQLKRKQFVRSFKTQHSGYCTVKPSPCGYSSLMDMGTMSVHRCPSLRSRYVPKRFNPPFSLSMKMAQRRNRYSFRQHNVMKTVDPRKCRVLIVKYPISFAGRPTIIKISERDASDLHNVYLRMFGLKGRSMFDASYVINGVTYVYAGVRK